MQRTRATRARAVAAPHPIHRLLAATPWLVVLWFAAIAGLATDAFGLTSVYMPPEALASRATLIVEATPTSVESAMDPESGRIATYVTLSVETVHRGPADLSEVVLRESGGRFGAVEHVVEGSPVYRPGQRVFAFLEPAGDGALRTVGAFQGNFQERLDDHGHRVGERLMAGHMVGEMPQPFREHHDHRDGSVDTIGWNDLISVSAAVPGPGVERRRPIPFRAGSAAPTPSTRWEHRPPEHSRLVRDVAASTVADGEVQAAFTPLGSPSRWYQSDSGTTVPFNIDPTGNPLGNAAAAVADEDPLAIGDRTGVRRSAEAVGPGDLLRQGDDDGPLPAPLRVGGGALVTRELGGDVEGLAPAHVQFGLLHYHALDVNRTVQFSHAEGAPLTLSF